MSDWWPAALAGLLYYVLGAAWFTPLFGQAWDRSIGHDRTRTAGRFPISYYVLPLAGSLVTAAVIAWLQSAVSVDGTGTGTGTLVGAGVGLAIAAASLTNALTPHTPHPYAFAAITGGYHLVGCTIAGLTVGLLSPAPKPCRGAGDQPDARHLDPLA